MKKIIALFLTFVMCLSGTVSAVAVQDEKLSETEIMLLAEKYGVNVTINSMDIKDYQPISITREELVSLFKQIAAEDKTLYDMGEIVIDSEMPERGVGRYIFRKWTPLRYGSFLGPSFSMTACRNARFEYNYANYNGLPRFTSEKDVKSWLSGVFLGVGWTELGSIVSFSKTNYYNDTANVKVDGYTYIGLDYEGLHLCVQLPPETWRFTLRFKSN